MPNIRPLARKKIRSLNAGEYMRNFISTLRSLPLLTLLVATQAFAAPTSIELSSEASRPAVNDLVRATVSADATGTSPGELSRQVNAQIADALKTAKAYSGIKAQTGGTSTYPIYAKGGKIEAWRMHSEISLESGDSAAIAELLGKLQNSLGVTSLALQPSPGTRQRAENDAILDAITAFKARAKLIADSFGKPYRIKQLAVNSGTRNVQPTYRGAAKSMLSESAPMPVEAGESLVSVTVSGQIELE